MRNPFTVAVATCLLVLLFTLAAVLGDDFVYGEPLDEDFR